ncbi:ABC transporter ATP-binding protein [Anaerosporobacter sp.]
MLLLNNVSISYKKKKETINIINNFCLQIEQGESVVILGASGCGKSTLVNTLAGTIVAESGDIVYVKEQKGRPLNPKIHKIGIIPQNCGLLPWKTVKENCLLPLRIRKEQVNDTLIEEITNIYKSLDIDKLLHKYPKELSGGQAQRAAIARAFIMRPDLLLMDEPFSALDEITREEARELFLKIWKQHKPTTILVTHSIEEALYLGNRIIVMGTDKGNIKYQMDNPYFGELSPQSLEYLVAKKLLRKQLIKTEVGE